MHCPRRLGQCIASGENCQPGAVRTSLPQPGTRPRAVHRGTGCAGAAAAGMRPSSHDRSGGSGRRRSGRRRSGRRRSGRRRSGRRRAGRVSPGGCPVVAGAPGLARPVPARARRSDRRVQERCRQAGGGRPSTRSDALAPDGRSRGVGGQRRAATVRGRRGGSAAPSRCGRASVSCPRPRAAAVDAADVVVRPQRWLGNVDARAGVVLAPTGLTRSACASRPDLSRPAPPRPRPSPRPAPGPGARRPRTTRRRSCRRPRCPDGRAANHAFSVVTLRPPMRRRCRAPWSAWR